MTPLTGASTRDAGLPDSSIDSGNHTRLWRDRILPGVVALLLGTVLIYAAGFASRVELHNAAHDGRHSAGFPCH